MTKSTIAERREFGYATIEEAMELLVSIYAAIPPEDLAEAHVPLPAGKVCDILDMFFEYVHEAEGIDIDGLMESVGMELSSTVLVLGDEEEPKIH